MTSIPAIVLPEKSARRERWLTRDEAARLLRAAWRMKQTWKGQESDRRTGRHIARFILVGLYTGTRSAAICGAAVRPTENKGCVDLDSGVFYRKANGERETKNRQPSVRLPDRLLAHIRRWASTPLDIKTKGRGKSQNVGRMISHDYVVEWNGKPVKSVKKAFRSACKVAGLGPDVTPNTLRHTAATWLMQNRSNLSDAADYLGVTEAVLREHYCPSARRGNGCGEIGHRIQPLIDERDRLHHLARHGVGRFSPPQQKKALPACRKGKRGQLSTPPGPRRRHRHCASRSQVRTFPMRLPS